MRFLLNMNLPRELGARLVALGHSTRHVGDIGLARASDETIVEEARRSGEVILFRVRNTTPANLLAQLSHAWNEVETPLLTGAIVVLEDALWRIRKLPITSA
jgi:predicted nuclease of predicted toxin-antitoxin system